MIDKLKDQKTMGTKLILTNLGVGAALGIIAGAVASFAVSAMSLGLGQWYFIMLAYLGMGLAVGLTMAMPLLVKQVKIIQQMKKINKSEKATNDPSHGLQKTKELKQDQDKVAPKKPMSDQAIAILTAVIGGLALGGIVGALASTVLPFMSFGLGQTYLIVLTYMAIGLGTGLLSGGITALAMKFKSDVASTGSKNGDVLDTSSHKAAKTPAESSSLKGSAASRRNENKTQSGDDNLTKNDIDYGDDDPDSDSDSEIDPDSYTL